MPFFDGASELQPGCVVELLGPSLGCKTEILLQVAANVLATSVPVEGNNLLERHRARGARGLGSNAAGVPIATSGSEYG